MTPFGPDIADLYHDHMDRWEAIGNSQRKETAMATYNPFLIFDSDGGIIGGLSYIADTEDEGRSPVEDVVFVADSLPTVEDQEWFDAHSNGYLPG